MPALTRPWLIVALALPALVLALVCRRQAAPAAERAAAVVPSPTREEAARRSPRLAPATIPVSVATAATISPHPITAERRALDRQRGLFIAVDGALAAGDVTRARELLQEHRVTYDDADAWLDLREGYEVIADCQEHPGPATAARGARFVTEHAGSTLRRRVRRACLGPRLPSRETP